jgi:hypothetical protein
LAFNSNVRANLGRRAQDFVAEKLQGMGHQDVNTNLVNQAWDQWGDNTQFQRDLQADTWMNRIALQDTEKANRAGAIQDLVQRGEINVQDLDTNDLNLMRGFDKEQQVNQAQFFMDRAAAGMFPDQKGDFSSTQLGELNRDTEVNLARMINTDALRHAREVNNAFNQASDQKAFLQQLSDADLGMLQNIRRMEDNGGENFTAQEALSDVRENKRVNKANEFLNNRLSSMGLPQVDAEEFSNRAKNTKKKFDSIKQERGVIGEGAFGAVVPGDNGNVMKLQGNASNVWNDGRITPNDAIQEADNLANVRGLNIAPEVSSVEMLPDGSSITEMQDLSKNFTTFQDRLDAGDLTQDEVNSINIKRNQQHAMANLRGVELQDRHTNNVMINNMTNRPIQVDFGIVSKFTDTSEQAKALGYNAASVMNAAGLKEEAVILNDIVNELRNAGDIQGAMDVAKQGMSRAMKLTNYQNVPTAAEILS